MSQTSLCVHIDSDIKKCFDEFCEDLFYSEDNQRRINNAIKRIEAGGGTVHEIIEDYS